MTTIEPAERLAFEAAQLRVQLAITQRELAMLKVVVAVSARTGVPIDSLAVDFATGKASDLREAEVAEQAAGDAIRTNPNDPLVVDGLP